MKVKQKVMRDQYKNTNSNSGRTMNERYKANNTSKHTDSTPLLFRLRGEQPSIMNKQNNLQNINTNNGRTHKAIQTKQMSKQLRIHSQISDDRKLMIKSTSAYEDQLKNSNNNNQFINHNKFIASSFIVEPTTTQSIKENRNQSNRYQQQQNKKQHQGRIQLSQSHQYNNFQSKQNGNSRYGNNSNPIRVERPLTFGLVNQQNYLSKENQTLRSSKELVEEKHLKSHILDEIQEQQVMKKELIDSDEEQHQQRNYKEIACTNHTLKKAKYRLLVELGQGQDQMFYCSKCAINLLQQGFKIESISQQENNNNNNIEIINYNNDRNNTLKLCYKKILNLKQRIEMDKDLFNNHSQTKIYEQNMNDKKQVYNKLIQLLNQMKTIDLKSLRIIYQQNSQILSHKQQTWISLEEQLQTMSQNLCNKQNDLLQVSEQQFRTQIEMLMNNLAIYEQLSSDYNNKMHNYPIKHHNKIIQQLLNSYNNEKKNNNNNNNNIKNHNVKQKIIKNSTNHHYEMFLCDETQHPFRNLFPDEVKGYQNGQYPTFGIYNATTIQ